MKTLAHLPENKQVELEKIAALIRANCADVAMIILYGSYARGDFREEKDLKADRKSGHVSDYDILVVSAQKQTALDAILWKKISDECQKLNLSASARIITHDIEALNIKLAQGQYFFSDVKREGIFLFNQEKFLLAEERNLTNQEKRRVAQDYFDEWLERADSFFFHHQIATEKKTLGLSAFFLHQAAESAYKGVLLVFSNYCPREHFLDFLGKDVAKYSSLMCDIFARVSQEDETRFKLLEYAYIGGRYDPNYRISKEDLEILSANVAKLLSLSKKLCEEKIESLV